LTDNGGGFKCMFVYIVYIEVNVHQILNIILNVKSKVAVKRGWGFQKIQTNTIKKIKESSPIKASRDMISK
jgi:hypothetical protein